MITVFTPTYNRAAYLKKLYDSLRVQTFKEFEWLVVDDGSSDNTKEVMNDFIKENAIKIHFISKINEGKHIAINVGVANAQGELFFTVDSDDYLTPTALERIQYHWNNVQKLPPEEKKWIIGVSGHRIYADGKIIGGDVDYDVLDIDLLEFRFKRKIKGDKAEVYLTDVVRKNPFPKFEGENFCPEALVYYRLANEGYKLRQFNEGIYVGEYLEGGLTNSGLKTVKNNPNATLLGYADVVNFKRIPLSYRLKYAVLFWRFSFYHKEKTFAEKSTMLKNKLFLLAYPAGWAMYKKDSR